MSPATVTVDESQPVIAESAPEARESSTAAPQVVTSLLAAVGLSPLATDSPLAPVAPPPTLFGALEWVRREILKTFFNQGPTIAYNPAQNSLVDGNIVGTLVANDPDGTGYTLTATKPANGEVVVNPDGTFVYTPGPDYDGRDTFNVTVTEADSGFHIHGLGGLLNLVTFGLLGESGHSTTRTITVGRRSSAIRAEHCRVRPGKPNGFPDPAGQPNPHRRKGRSHQGIQRQPAAERTADHAPDQHDGRAG